MDNTLLNSLLSDLLYVVEHFERNQATEFEIRQQFSLALQQYTSELRLYLAYMRFLVKTESVNELESVVLTCFSQHPNNSWLILQSVESLISVHSPLVFEILSNYYSAADIVDERRWKLVFNSLSSYFDSYDAFAFYLSSLLSKSPNDFYIHSKLGQLYYLQHHYDLAYQSLIKASGFAPLRSSSLILLSESALFLNDSLQYHALSMVISENQLRPKFELFHHICLFSILFQRVDDSISTFLSDFRLYSGSWQLLHWFNRLPLNVTQVSFVMSALDVYFQLNRKSLDWRWQYHYAISLMLQSRITDALLVLHSYRSDRTDVSVLQNSLSSLAERLLLFSPSQNRPVDWTCDFVPLFIDCFSDVIVVFSGWTGALGYVSDSTIADYFHQLGFNLLIIRDPSLKFFSGGLAPSKFTSNYSIELQLFLASKTSGQVYFCGDSISALAAIHHACQFPASIKVIAFSPVLSKDEYSALGLSHFDSVMKSSRNDFVHQTRGHQSLIRIEATRNLYCNIFKLLETVSHVDLHIVYAELNKTDSLVARSFLEHSNATLHCLKDCSVHLVSNEFIASDHFHTLLQRINSSSLNPSIYEY